MAKTKTITLGGVDFTVHPFNLDELQEVGELLGDGKAVNGATTIQILKIALRRAEPQLEHPGAVEGSMREVAAATTVLLELAGLDASPQTATAPVAS